jgi:hypothetical protein
MLPFLPLKANTMMTDAIPLSITLQCEGNPGCVYQRKPMVLKINIKNDGTKTVGFPLEFLSKSGPITKFIDTETAAFTYARRGLANPALKKEFTNIAPGAVIVLDTDLSTQELEAFRVKRVDMTVEVILKAKVKVEGAPELVDFQGAARTRVIEKEQ